MWHNPAGQSNLVLQYLAYPLLVQRSCQPQKYSLFTSLSLVLQYSAIKHHPTALKLHASR